MGEVHHNNNANNQITLSCHIVSCCHAQIDEYAFGAAQKNVTIQFDQLNLCLALQRFNVIESTKLIMT